MSKIFKPLIFVITLVVAFAVGYTIGPGKGQGVDNSDEIKRLQKQVSQKNKQVAALQQSLDALKNEQSKLRKDLESSKKQLGATSTVPIEDGYADASAKGDTPVKDLTFYSDLPKQKVTPEPLKADPAKAKKDAAAAATVNPIKLAQEAQQDQAKKAGTSSKPLSPDEVKTPDAGKSITSTASKTSSTLPARYIPAGFNGSTAARHHVAKEGSKSTRTANYVVQLASYKTEAATETLRKNLAKLGFSADIRKATIKSGTTVYRVVVGPYSGYSKAKAAKAALKKKTKLDGLIVNVG